MSEFGMSVILLTLSEKGVLLTRNVVICSLRQFILSSPADLDPDPILERNVDTSRRSSECFLSFFGRFFEQNHSFQTVENFFNDFKTLVGSLF